MSIQNIVDVCASRLYYQIVVSEWDHVPVEWAGIRCDLSTVGVDYNLWSAFRLGHYLSTGHAAYI